ncbi:MAG: helix-turn-helix transcriptional regulator [Gammaproteobacteria bacterium]|nr:helix-turn-helix transcriptional regulator [Gammaproteobacteria bacterium]
MPVPFAMAPLPGAHSRRMPGLFVISAARKILMANAAAVEMLRPVLGTDFVFAPNCGLPTALEDLVDEIEQRLQTRQEFCSIMLPSCDLCVRACWLEARDHWQLMLVVERASRQDMVRTALASFSLTPRETEVATLVLRGYSNRRIADNLVLAEYTVEDHLKRIFAKVGVRTRTSLASKILGAREEATG